MSEVSRNAPGPMTFVREAVDDLAAYLAMWRVREAARDKSAARAAAGMALERIDAATDHLARLRGHLAAEAAEFDRAAGAAVHGRAVEIPADLHDSNGDGIWTDTGSGAGYIGTDHHDPRD